MTLEELKVEADKLGYGLIKKPERIKFLPCVCGCNLRHHYYSYYGSQHFKCKRCGLESPSGNSEREARLNWNKMIEENNT